MNNDGLRLAAGAQTFAVGDGQLVGGNRIKPLPCPLSLPANFKGVIVAQGYNAQELKGNGNGGRSTDTGGGAIYVLGSKHGVVIADSTFEDNAASNAGAVGGLFAELAIYDSLFQRNTGLGHDANNNDPAQCSFMNNGQYEIGSGGNGGAIYSDGASVDVTLCGDRIVDNAAGTNAFGGGLFFTSNDFGGDLVITDTVMSGNTGGHWTQVSTGATTNAGTAVGTNTHSLTITNSQLQGL